jgi:DNA-binding response OmpR family regulator
MESGSSLILCVGFSGGTGVARERALSSAGFRVSVISEPLKAITSARQAAPQVVIIDDHEISDWRELADCLVIAASSSNVIVLVDAPEQPSPSIAAVLSKPISPEGLVQAVQAVLKESAARKLRSRATSVAIQIAAIPK